MDFKTALLNLTQHRPLERLDMEAVMGEMLLGKFSSAQVTAFFMALKMKGETFDEQLGAALAVKRYINPVSINTDQLVSVCRLGGELLGYLDLSIASSFAAAAAGSKLVVHDGSAFASRDIASKFLDLAGINIQLTIEQIQTSIEMTGVGFTLGTSGFGLPQHFAQAEIPNVSTLVNILNLVTNPFHIKKHFIGVEDVNLCKPIAELFSHLGAERVMVVHGTDGLDAISLASETRVVEIHRGNLTEYIISPDDFGVQSKSLIGLKQDSAEESLLLIKDALGNRRGHYAEKAADMIILNAGAVIYVSGIADSLRHGVSLAREVVANTLAGEKIRQAATVTQRFKNKA